jgi:hypothetical protein
MSSGGGDAKLFARVRSLSTCAFFFDIVVSAFFAAAPLSIVTLIPPFAMCLGPRALALGSLNDVSPKYVHGEL